MKKTIGGDRLGSGKKMKVDLHNYSRSTHDLGYIWRSSMAAGTLVPFMSEVALPGDTFDINLDGDIKTLPTIGPLFGSYKVQLDVFLCPIRLYNSLLHNNALGIGLKMANVKLPVYELQGTDNQNATDIDNSHTNPSSLPAYFGIRGTGRQTQNVSKRRFNALPIIAYWDIYKNYYANKMEEIGALVATEETGFTEIEATCVNGTGIVIPFANPGTATVRVMDQELVSWGSTQAVSMAGIPQNSFIMVLDDGTEYNATEIFTGWSYTATGVTGNYNGQAGVRINVAYWRYSQPTDVSSTIEVNTFPLENIDNLRNEILAWQDESAPFVLPNYPPYSYIIGNNPSSQRNKVMNSQQGLALKTYNSDLFNNWLNTEWIDGSGGISELTAIDTSAGNFTLDTLNLSKKVYDMLNRIAISGGTYDDWLDAVYAHDRYKRAETPMYMGGLIKELVFQEVVSNTGTQEQPLGSLAGKGRLSGKHKGGKIVIKVDEPAYIIGLISLTPRIDYSAGNKWDTTLKTLDDLHKPALDEIGFQELITDQMAFWDTDMTGEDTYTLKSAGKQPAWLNYMTNVNVVRGNFAIPDNQMFMTLNRRYEYGGSQGILDLTTYIDPAKFNFIFAETQRDAQNFWAQIAVDITARRKMSARLMPNL
ncbi:MAG: major capsid protein [Microviridae sp.]|nr:MAG: major capsid protein [Microviridae sp.]